MDTQSSTLNGMWYEGVGSIRLVFRSCYIWEHALGTFGLVMNE